MGQSISATASPSAEERKMDEQVLLLAAKNLFNEAYCKKLCGKLPKGEEEQEGDEKRAPPAEARLSRLMTLFSKDKGNIAVEDFHSLDPEGDVKKHPFQLSNKIRGRVLARVLQAYIRSGGSDKADASASTKEVISFLQSMSDVISDTTSKASTESSSDVLFSMTAMMCVDIAKAVSVSQPLLFKQMAESMMRLLQVASSYSLRDGNASPALRKTVETLQEYAQLIADEQKGETRSAALGLLLAIAISTGSLKSVLAVADTLASGSDTLPGSAEVFLQQLKLIKSDLDIDTLVNAAGVDVFPPTENINCGSPSIACDGAALFMWDSASCAISKVGTGFYGTVAGVEMNKNASIKEQIATWLSANGDSRSSSASSSLGGGGAIMDNENEQLEGVTLNDDDGLPVFRTGEAYKASSITLTSPLCATANATRNVLAGVAVNVDFDLVRMASTANCGNYFEVEIGPSTANITVGFVTNQLTSSIINSPFGIATGSYAIRSSDGAVLSGDGSNLAESFPTWNGGDVVGFGINAAERTLFFTHNGDVIGLAFALYEGVTKLTPVINFLPDNSGSASEGQNASVTLNMGASPFRYSGSEMGQVFPTLEASPRGGATGGAAIASGAQVESKKKNVQASIAVAGGKVHLRSFKLLGKDGIAIFSKSSLKLEKIVNLTSIVSSNSDSLEQQQTRTFEFDDEEEIDVRVPDGYKLTCVSASFHDQDITGAINEHIEQGDGTFLNIPNLAAESAPGQGSRFIGTFKAEFKSVGSVTKSSTDLSSVSLMSSNSNHLVIVEGVSSKPKTLFINAAKAITFGSCVYYPTFGSNGVVSPKFEELWKLFLKEKDKVNVLVENDTFGDQCPGQVKTLFVNFFVATPSGDNIAQSVSFVEHAKIDFGEILRIAENILTEVKTVMRAVVLDPSHDMSVVSSATLNVPAAFSTKKERLMATTLLFNGQKLIMQQLLKQLLTSPQSGYSVRRGTGNYSEAYFCSSCNYNERQCGYCSGLLVQPFDFSASSDASAVALNYKFNVETGELLHESEETFKTADGVPATACYDTRHNMLWAFDGKQKIRRWRNSGASPRIKSQLAAAAAAAAQASSSPAALLLLDDASLRVDALIDSSKPTIGGVVAEPSRQAALIYSLVDKLSEVYGPTDASESLADVIAISCQGYTSSGYRHKITIHGSIKSEYDSSVSVTTTGSQGINLVTLSESFEVLSNAAFNVSDDSGAAERMAAFIEAVPLGRIVLVASNYTASSPSLTPKVIAKLYSLGATDLERLSMPGGSSNYTSLAIIGRKGAKKGTAAQAVKYNDNHEPLFLTQRIPTMPIPLAVEPSKELFSHLIKTTGDQFSKFMASSDSAYNTARLISSLRILTTNVFRLMQGTLVEKALETVSPADRETLKTLVQSMMSCNSSSIEGASVVSECATQLFITSIGLLYPTPDDRQTLLMTLVNSFLSGGQNKAAGSVLGLVLEQMSSPAEMAIITNSGDSNKTLEMLTVLVNIFKLDLNSRIQALVGDSAQPLSGGLGDVSNTFIISISSSLLSKGAVALISEEEGGDPGLAISVLKTITSICADITSVIAAANNQMMAKNPSSPKIIDPELEAILAASPVAILLPVALLTVNTLVKANASKIILKSSTVAIEAANLLVSYRASIVELLQLVPGAEAVEETGPTTTVTTKVFESQHPYTPSLDQYVEHSFPGATKISVVFDTRTRTENGCDYLRFVDINNQSASVDPNFQAAGDGRMTGRDGSGYWPGLNGQPEYVFPAGITSFKTYFHSDGSVEDWGFACTFTVEITEMGDKQVKQHFLRILDHQILDCVISLASAFIIGEPINEALEEPNSAYIENSLVSPALFEGGVGTSEGDVLLHDLVDRPEGSLAASLASIMHPFVSEDQGTVVAVNRAVYATCAAIIKANGLVAEAVSIAKGVRSAREISATFTKAWRAGQKMRAFFELGDLRGAAVTTASAGNADSVVSRPSVYSGSDDKVIEAASDATIERALFLIRSTDGVSLTRTPSSTKARWALLANATKKGAASSLVAAVKQKSDSVKLKRSLSHRRAQAEKLKKKITKTEEVLQFVQSHVDIRALEQIHALRTKRVENRIIGIDIVKGLMSVSTNPFDIFWIASIFAETMRECKHAGLVGSNSLVHYANGTRCASISSTNRLLSKFNELLVACNDKFYISNAMVIETLSSDESSSSDRKAWKSAAVGCLRAVAMDYNIPDHEMLDATDILGVINSALSSEDKDIAEAADALLEILVNRCVGLDGQDELAKTAEPTLFSRKLANLLVSRLDLIATEAASLNAAFETSSSDPDAQMLVKGCKSLARESVGYTAPHNDIGFQHTFSLWIRRPRCPALDASSELKVVKKFSKVIRSVASPNMENDLETGVVISLDEDSEEVAVKWAGGAETTIKSSELNLVDESVGGVIYSKGCPALNGNIKMRLETLPSWGLFGLQMLPDSTLSVFMTSGKKLPSIASGGYGIKSVRGSHFVAPDTWTHVAVVQDRLKVSLYVNGVLDTEGDLDEAMLNPGSSTVSAGGPTVDGPVVVEESPHPYLDNQDICKTITVPGAVSLKITFDNQSLTEQNYDYVTFYVDDSHTAFHGEQKYSGGRGGSSRNFPGTEGRPPLVIPGNSFVLYFHS